MKRIKELDAEKDKWFFIKIKNNTAEIREYTLKTGISVEVIAKYEIVEAEITVNKIYVGTITQGTVYAKNVEVWQYETTGKFKLLLFI